MHHVAKGEIDPDFSFTDIVNAIYKNWYFFAISIIICLSAGYMFSGKADKIYESQTIIQIGLSASPTGEMDYVTPPKSLVKRLAYDYKVGEAHPPLPYIFKLGLRKNASVSGLDEKIVSLSFFVRGRTPQETNYFLEQIEKEIITQYLTTPTSDTAYPSKRIMRLPVYLVAPQTSLIMAFSMFMGIMMGIMMTLIWSLFKGLCRVSSSH